MKQFDKAEIAEVLLEHTYEDHGCACGIRMHKLSNRDPGPWFLAHLSTVIASIVNTTIKESEGEDATADFEEKFIKYVQSQGLVTRTDSASNPPVAQVVAFSGDIYRQYKDDFDKILGKIVADRKKEVGIKGTFGHDGTIKQGPKLTEILGVTSSIHEDLERWYKTYNEDEIRKLFNADFPVNVPDAGPSATKIITGTFYSDDGAVQGTGPRANIYVSEDGNIYINNPVIGNTRRRNAGWPGIEHG